MNRTSLPRVEQRSQATSTRHQSRGKGAVALIAFVALSSLPLAAHALPITMSYFASVDVGGYVQRTYDDFTVDQPCPCDPNTISTESGQKDGVSFEATQSFALFTDQNEDASSFAFVGSSTAYATVAADLPQGEANAFAYLDDLEVWFDVGQPVFFSGNRSLRDEAGNVVPTGTLIQAGEYGYDYPTGDREAADTGFIGPGETRFVSAGETYDFNFAAVPEPQIILLFGPALGLLLFPRIKRRSA